MPICGPFAHSENYWTIIKLDENETMVSNTSKYSEHIEPDLIKKLTEEKIKTFIAIEELLNTKYGENNKNNMTNKKNIKEDELKK